MPTSTGTLAHRSGTHRRPRSWAVAAHPRPSLLPSLQGKDLSLFPIDPIHPAHHRWLRGAPQGQDSCAIFPEGLRRNKVKKSYQTNEAWTLGPRMPEKARENARFPCNKALLPLPSWWPVYPAVTGSFSSLAGSQTPGLAPTVQPCL